MSYESYRTRVNLKGSTDRSRTINNYKETALLSLYDSPSYYQVTQNNSSTPLDTWIVDDSTTKEQKLLLTLDSSYSFGDYIHWNDETWLTLIVDDMGGIYKRGTIKRCISSLKWLDNEGEVKEAWFTFKGDTGSSFGIQDGRLISMGNERRSLIVQSNSDTLTFSKNQRFIFDSRVWRVVSIDTISMDGIINLTLEENDINTSTDNLELRIADYIGNAANYSLTILNGANFSIHAGTSLQLDVEVKNNNEIVNKPVVYSSSNTSIATVNSTGLINALANGNVVISAKLADDLTVMDSINGDVQFEIVNNYTISLNTTDPIVVSGTSETFTMTVKNNGVVDNSRFVQWFIYADDKVSAPLNVTMPFSSTTQCTIKANSNASGYVQVKAVLIGSPSVFAWFRIKIMSLI